MTQKSRYTFIFILSLLLSHQIFAANGDSTWVTVFQNRNITYNGSMDTTLNLPNNGTSYRKIIAYYILGKYQCPAGSQYCGSWDYTSYIYTNDSSLGKIQMAKVITPYATTGNYTRAFGYDWTNTYVLDVSDYASFLNGNRKISYVYDGYSFGFSLTLKILYIEGTPTRDVKKFDLLQQGYFRYGRIQNPINTALAAKKIYYASNVDKTVVKTNISGHGSYTNSQCSEFCFNKFKISQDSVQKAYNDIWRLCGSTNLYPQTGTWLYDRGNWCPGEIVENIYNTIDTKNAGDSSNIKMDVDQVFTPDSVSSAVYLLSMQAIQYGTLNKTLDASLDDIKNPTNADRYQRNNYSCQSPIVLVSNTGSTTINSIKFEYGLSKGVKYNYTFSGNIPSETNLDIALPYINDIRNATDDTNFVVKILQVNGVSDNDISNNTNSSVFYKVPVWPVDIVIQTYGNNQKNSNGYSENTWKITDETGAIVYEKKNFPVNTFLRDTMYLKPGCYTFTATDASCDGMNWWVFQYYSPYPGTGWIKPRSTSSATILPMKNYYSGDFGCGFSSDFSVADWIQNTDNIIKIESLNIYPNPAKDIINIDFIANDTKVQWSVLDLKGQKILSGNSSSLESIDISSLANGMYFLEITNSKNVFRKNFVKNK